MTTRSRAEQFVTAVSVIGAAVFLPTSGYAQAKSAPYPRMAPIGQYSMTPSAEIALAKSAAPAAISGDADVLVLGATGYEKAVKGKNGFVCLVQRAWANEFGDPGFWNPKLRGPMCFNPAAARSVLPTYLTRTQWVLSAVSEKTMKERELAAAKGTSAPEAGAMCYMLSKAGYLGDDAGGPWHPHLMFFLPRTPSATWGANVDHSPVVFNDGPGAAFTTFMVVVSHWSDGAEDSRSGQ
jgi:hypothetical protein